MRVRLPLLVACVLAALSAACASSNAVPRPFPGGPVASGTVPPPEEHWPSAPATSGSAEPVLPGTIERPDLDGLTTHHYDGRAVAEYALAFRGVPYRFGGADPAGFDCSGLVQYVFAQYGFAVPRIVEEQWEVGEKLKPWQIKPGDLLFFSTQGSGASHVAISLGGDQFVHAPNSSGVVRVEALSSTYWGSHYMGARRVNAGTVSN